MSRATGRLCRAAGIADQPDQCDCARPRKRQRRPSPAQAGEQAIAAYGAQIDQLVVRRVLDAQAHARGGDLTAAQDRLDELGQALYRILQDAGEARYWRVLTSGGASPRQIDAAAPDGEALSLRVAGWVVREREALDDAMPVLWADRPGSINGWSMVAMDRLRRLAVRELRRAPRVSGEEEGL